MIKKTDSIFEIQSENTSYIFKVLKTGQLENLYYGKSIRLLNVKPLEEKRVEEYPNSVIYNKEDNTLYLENACLEYSGIGKGDYRIPAYEIELPDSSFILDFKYESYEIYGGAEESTDLPFAVGSSNDAETLKITLKDAKEDIYLYLYYTVFYKCDVITRKAKVVNKTEKEIRIKRLMSSCLDLQEEKYSLITFDGAWARELHKNEKSLLPGIYENSSATGASSNRHNPFFMVKKEGAGETFGEVYGFNLIYSGNHFEALEVNPYSKLRILQGINPLNFNFTLNPSEEFMTPEAVMSFSYKGFDGLSTNMHYFIREHIVRGEWKYKERPILLNNWEGTYFNFNEDKLLKLASGAKDLGIELFVLDDGWFSRRNDDKSSLGDWVENKEKLPSGIKGLAEKIKEMGLMFGLWFEPEMISFDSNLYRNHPDFAVKIPGRNPSEGRNQLVLDLTREDVKDYVVESILKVIDSAPIDYVKWDMNRHMSDIYSLKLKNQGEFCHRYILGLYDILRRVCYSHPHILFESCSSGGNRFDLGMLAFMPQVWTSDDTDALERMYIQESASYGYPQSIIGAHVSTVPNHQTARVTPLETRFNVASFGLLGYELDINLLSHEEKDMIKEDIKFYKKYRKTLQFGSFKRLKSIYEGNKAAWMSVNSHKSEAVALDFTKLSVPNPSGDILKLRGIKEEEVYKVLRRDKNEEYEAFGDLLMEAGIKQGQKSFYKGKNKRSMGDFTSDLYIINENK